ncbi:hypothetical protein Y032_0896g2920 [Ancylostoma ceylanicum]|uniref:Uncharacterized protein n=1 Tax=Ancylostoma ceylanicum TaxID=53326 RepID=A0A016W9X7_9BILA|nr:hypothetical protein Y032_0896g2920 [Ancylostoma ceylanicum]
MERKQRGVFSPKNTVRVKSSVVSMLRIIKNGKVAHIRPFLKNFLKFLKMRDGIHVHPVNSSMSSPATPKF